MDSLLYFQLELYPFWSVDKVDKKDMLFQLKRPIENISWTATSQSKKMVVAPLRVTLHIFQHSV